MLGNSGQNAKQLAEKTMGYLISKIAKKISYDQKLVSELMYRRTSTAQTFFLERYRKAVRDLVFEADSWTVLIGNW